MSATSFTSECVLSANCVLSVCEPKTEMALDFVVFSADTARTGGFRPHPFNLSLSIALLYGAQPPPPPPTFCRTTDTECECSSLCRDCSTRFVCVCVCVCSVCVVCFFIFFLLVCLLCGMWLYVILFAANLLSSAHTAHIRMERNVGTHKN